MATVQSKHWAGAKVLTVTRTHSQTQETMKEASGVNQIIPPLAVGARDFNLAELRRATRQMYSG